MNRTIVSRYRLPVAASCEADDLRIHHEDLPTMDALELWSEDQRVTQALAQAVEDEHQGRRLSSVRVDGRAVAGTVWLRQRMAAVEAERSRHAAR